MIIHIYVFTVLFCFVLSQFNVATAAEISISDKVRNYGYGNCGTVIKSWTHSF